MSFTTERLKRKEKRVKSKVEGSMKELSQRKAIGYVRVSTEKQEKEGYGMDFQITKIKDYCRKHNLKVHHIYKDTFTGKSDDREGFNDLGQDVKNKKVKILITYKLDRLGRSQIKILNFIELLHENQVQLITLEPEMDYNSTSGQIILSNLSLFAELERNMIVERTENGRIQKYHAGSKVQGSILGYVHNKKTKRYEIVPAEKNLVEDIYYGYLDLRSLAKLARKLNREGVATKRGNPFSKQNLHLILTNRFYLGYVKYEGKEKLGNHDPIVNRILFGRVQAILERNRKV